MQRKSSPTAKVRFLDGPKAVEALRQRAQTVVQEHPQVLEIYLFGSLARGNYAPGSDADLLLVLDSDERPFLGRIPPFLRLFQPGPVPVEVFPYTRSELARMQGEGNPFILSVMRQAVKLAGRE